MLSVLELLIAAIDFAFNRRDKSEDEKRVWFDTYIKSTFEKISEVNDDYRQSLLEAAKMLEHREDPKRVVEILEERQLVKFIERREIQDTLKKVRDFSISDRSLTDLEMYFVNYVHSIERYFYGTSPLNPGLTWFGYFIKTIKDDMSKGKNPYENDFRGVSQGNKVFDEAPGFIRGAVKDEMPRALESMTKAYVNLKIECLGDGNLGG